MKRGRRKQRQKNCCCVAEYIENFPIPPAVSGIQRISFHDISEEHRTVHERVALGSRNYPTHRFDSGLETVRFGCASSSGGIRTRILFSQSNIHVIGSLSWPLPTRQIDTKKKDEVFDDISEASSKLSVLNLDYCILDCQ